MPFSLIYDLEGAGWAMARIEDGSAHFHVTVSYLHDSLTELAEAAISLTNGDKSASVIFMDEPGEVHLLLDVKNKEEILYELRWFDDWASWNIHPADDYKIIHSGQAYLQEFTASVRGQLEELLQTYGEMGYKERWIEHEFPLALLLKIQTDGIGLRL
jgi:hypothetical protein